MGDEFLTTKHLMVALRQAHRKHPGLNIGRSYLTLLTYIKKGIVKAPEKIVEVGSRKWKFYTKEEIEESVKRVIEYKKKFKEKI